MRVNVNQSNRLNLSRVAQPRMCFKLTVPHVPLPSLTESSSVNRSEILDTTPKPHVIH